MNICPLNHRCVVCRNLTLDAGSHEVRGLLIHSGMRKCADYLNVRCHRCAVAGRLPDPNLYRPWWELTDQEAIEHKSKDGRKIFYEVESK
jgi:hypothetical protein